MAEMKDTGGITVANGSGRGTREQIKATEDQSRAFEGDTSALIVMSFQL